MQILQQRDGGEREWQYVYSTCTATVTVTYTDTLTEGVGKRVTVRAQYTYHYSYCDLHGYSDRGGHAQCVATLSHDLSYDVCVCVGETHVHGLYMHIPCVRVPMDVQMVLRQSTAAQDIPRINLNVKLCMHRGKYACPSQKGGMSSAKYKNF